MASPILRLVPLLAATTCTALLAGPAPAYAHHSYAMFDKTQTRTLEGALYAVEWQNPHSWIWVEVRGTDGAKSSVWGFEGGSPAQLTNMGYSKTNLVIGTRVTVKYYPLKDGRNGGSLIELKLPKGQLATG